MRTWVILECMLDDRSQADRILVAQLTGEARHRAKWRPLTAAGETAAIAELRALAGGRPICSPRPPGSSRVRPRAS
jgi:hypothetical protein